MSEFAGYQSEKSTEATGEAQTGAAGLVNFRLENQQKSAQQSNSPIMETAKDTSSADAQAKTPADGASTSEAAMKAGFAISGATAALASAKELFGLGKPQTTSLPMLELNNDTVAGRVAAGMGAGSFAARPAVEAMLGGMAGAAGAAGGLAMRATIEGAKAAFGAGSEAAPKEALKGSGPAKDNLGGGDIGAGIRAVKQMPAETSPAMEAAKIGAGVAAGALVGAAAGAAWQGAKSAAGIGSRPSAEVPKSSSKPKR